MERGNRRERQRGLTLIEMLFAIAGFAILSVAITDQIRIYNERGQAAIIGEQMRTIAEAAERYLQDNHSAGDGIDGRVAPGAALRIPVGAMAEYLPSGFESRVGRRQTACVLVGRTAVDRPLEAVVVTTGGERHEDALVSRISREIGAMGGGVFDNTATFGEGISGETYSMAGGTLAALGFEGPNECPVGTSIEVGGVRLEPGSVAAALAFSPNRFDAGVLYRNAIAGRPELNEMNTDLGLGDNDILDVGNIAVNDRVAAEGEIVSDENIISRENLISTNGDVRAPQGQVFAKDLVLRNARIRNDGIRVSNGVYYANVIPSDTLVEKPNCESGDAQIHGGISSAALEVAPGRFEPYVASAIEIDDLGDEWRATLWLLDEDGQWQAVGSGSRSRLSVFTKCVN